MVDVKTLLDYNHYLRQRYLETLSELRWEDVVKDRGASFSSLRDIFLHCVSVEDLFINHIIQGDTTYPRINYDDYTSIEKIKEYVHQVEVSANAYLNALTPEELLRKVERTRRDGSRTVATVEDYLIQIFQEETHHRGELIALLWQMDVTPPHLGWTQYINR